VPLMADESVKLRSSITRYKQYIIDLERTAKKLKNQLRKAVKENKHLLNENAKLKRRLRELDKNR
jgi:regulator of replication initiation timing